MEQGRKYTFSWNHIGDIADGRPNLGNTASVEAYRLMQFSCRDVMEQYLGTEKTDEVFYQAGKLAGKEFYNHVLTPTKDFNEFLRQLQLALLELGIGILRVEKTDLEHGELVWTVSEDIDCSGLPEMDFEICTYDEGFISSLLECFSGVPFQVKEVDCWCTGDRTCRFRAKAIK
ncbi:putative hydrocarbon binding protein (contains V4R domain) [Desulfosporosinus acidiphilus SJ4]|uniref:Putative hydrocarbon binding protein (Contains V4R domain) n=1 Tax=Desulfosporosinus acidiphilus (strain DSM 22704 / JCM 16185 / SJ4) TaxID=646529 RepID=I4D1P5_DESAJ|nr:V4R domain-containing protein [Desulfosporosinus acidiphilus]AFM39719.1 putative hydrocarbon binding protein (contains V4R domain) [Desulfosporosinus acidiphilus SJ4]